MEKIILQTLKKMRTDYGNNEMIIFAQDCDLQVVADEIKTAINYTRCCKSDSELLLFSADEIVSKINEQTVLDGETFRVYFCEK
jgi:uncharacterized protein with PIN domain